MERIKDTPKELRERFLREDKAGIKRTILEDREKEVNDKILKELREYAQKYKEYTINKYKKISLVGVAYENVSFDETIDSKVIGFKKAKERLETYCNKFEQIKHMKENSVYLWSNANGTGKTHLAHCIRIKLKDYAIMFTSFELIIDKIKESWKDKNEKDSELEFINLITGVDLLIIDDFGAETMSDFVLKTIYKIINKFVVDRIPLIITSNISIDEFVNENIEDLNRRRIGDRLKGACVEIKLKLEKPQDSFRRRKEEILF
jgi:DNA replication protein DnaC